MTASFSLPRHKWTRRQQLAFGLIFMSGCLLVFDDLSQNLHQLIRGDMPGAVSWASTAQGEVALSAITYDAGTTIETTIPYNPPPSGFVIFDRLYVWNKTFYAVTSNPSAFPSLVYVLSQPKNLQGGVQIDPTPKEMQIISPNNAQAILGTRAVVMSGMSYIVYDNAQFMKHYYHWWGEIILGAVRAYSMLSLLLGPLPEPARFILPNVADNEWRDRAGVDGPLMRAAWPNTPIERGDLWNDMAALNQTFVFERAMIISRAAAHKSPLASVWYKMISSTMNSTAPANFWEPIRRRAVENTISYLPVLNNAGVVLSSPKSRAPVVTYISRQNGGRSLLPDAHDGLVAALQKLDDDGICQFTTVAMEKLSFSEQLEIAARTTIMIGIHGNGLTHQLWMPPSPRSTVIEIFWPETYAHDYVFLSRNMGHKHYGMWNDTYATFPEGEWFKGVNYGKGDHGKGFHGDHVIPVHGPAVADIVRERLTG